MICPVCRAQIGRYAWQPFNVSGSLSIAWTCPNHHSGQINNCELPLQTIGGAPAHFPQLTAKIK